MGRRTGRKRREGWIKGKVDERLRRGGETSLGARKSKVQEKWIKGRRDCRYAKG